MGASRLGKNPRGMLAMSIEKNKKKDSNKNKRPKETPNNKKSADSNNASKVHFSKYIKTEWKDGIRLPTSIRINSELYKEFKPVSKVLFGSICRAIESFMAAVVIAERNNVHFSNTQHNVRIGELHIERPVRPRRYLPEQDFEIFKQELSNSLQKCYCCNKISEWICATTYSVNPNKFLCSYHMERYSRRGEIIKKELIENSKK